MWDTIKNNKIPIIVISIIGIIFIFIAFSYGTYHANPNSEVVQKYVNDKLKEEKEKYDKSISEKTQQINELSEQLQVSQQNVYKKQTEINKLKKEMSSITTPLNLQETKERLKKLGYSPK